MSQFLLEQLLAKSIMTPPSPLVSPLYYFLAKLVFLRFLKRNPENYFGRLFQLFMLDVSYKIVFSLTFFFWKKYSVIYICF